MDILLFFIVYAFFFYVRFILNLTKGYHKVSSHKAIQSENKNSFSIIVPFRNEAQNLPELLASLSALEYPKSNFEFIFIDDHSTDESQRILTNWRLENGLFSTTMLENLRITGAPKKDAIKRAIPIATYDWIVTLDADCEVHPKWLNELDSFISNNQSKMVVGGVGILSQKGFLNRFQQVDFLSLQATTIASFGNNNPFMCNGANFAYQKNFFITLNGFQGNHSIASGDDVFLLQKAIAKHPDVVHYLKSEFHTIWTKSEKSWKSLFNQRVRWAAKSTHYENDYGETLAIVVFFGNLSIVVATLLFAFGSISLVFPMILFIAKYIVDYRLLRLAYRDFYGKKRFMPLLSSLIYPFFSTLVAIYALLGSYTWKERSFKR